MSQGDTILINGVKFLVKSRKGSRILIEWMDSKAGLINRWIIIK